MNESTETTPTQPSPEDAKAAWDAELKARQAPAQAAAADEPEQGGGDSVDAGNGEPEKKEPTAEERLAAEAARVAELTTALERERGRTSALQRKLDTELAAAKAKGGPTKEELEAALADPEEWAQMKADWPEVAVAMEKKLEKEIARLKAQQPAAPSEDAIAEAVAEALSAHEASRVERKHPKWRDLAKTNEFQSWLAKQPVETQSLANSPYADDAIDLFSKYKADDKKAQADALTARRQAALATAATDKPTQRQVPQQRTDEESPEAIWAAEARRRSQRRAA